MNVYVERSRLPFDGGYVVRDQDTHRSIGRVVPVLVTQRGRLQTRRRWQARDVAGNPVGQLRGRRVDAATELAKAREAQS